MLLASVIGLIAVALIFLLATTVFHVLPAASIIDPSHSILARIVKAAHQSSASHAITFLALMSCGPGAVFN